MAESEKTEEGKKELNRHEFLVGRGAAITAGTPTTARAASKNSYPGSNTMEKRGKLGA